MATNVRFPNGVDTDSAWARRVSPIVIGPTNVRASDGQDFYDRYERYNGAGQTIPANIRSGDGVDLSLRFTTAASIPRDWGTVNSASTGTPGDPPVATISFRSNGNIAIIRGGGTGSDWSFPNAQVGQLYQIIHTVTRRFGSGSESIPVGVWLNLDSGQTIEVLKNNNGQYRVEGNSTIRKKSDGVAVCSGNWIIEAEYHG